MRNLAFIVFILLFSLTQTSGCSQALKDDQLILSNIFNELADKNNRPIGELVVETGKLLLETPYVAHTLENGQKENLIVNLRQLDCTTFAENCLAISRCVKKGNTSFEEFKSELEQIRYRNGNRDGYCSRLHYFSEWINNNVKKEIVEIPTELQTDSVKAKINFMSAHPGSYVVLKENPELVKIISEQEQIISSQPKYVLSKAGIKEKEQLLEDGDIIGITTSIKGLDVVHVGIVITISGKKHLLHASTREMKVEISQLTIHEFLQQKKSYTGIIVARPVY